MSEVISIPRVDWDRLEERARRLAQEKSYLQLVTHLMNSLSEVPGLERTAETIIRGVLDHLGGASIALYYRIGERLHYLDAYGERRQVETVEDPLVRRAFERRAFVEELRDFADTKMATPEFTKASYWALPLIVAGQVVGVLKMEGMLMAAAEGRRQLQPFFNYAAVILKNEIEGFLKLMEASQLAAIVQNSDDAIIGKSLAGIITSWNKGAERLYGYAAHEVVGRPITLLAPPGREDEVSEIRARLAEGQLIEHFETQRCRKDGQVIHVSVTVSPIRNAAGYIVGASTIARDITERKRAEESLRHLNRELRAVGDCNQTLLRATDEPSLLNEVCRIVCDEAGYRMAWVGYAEPDDARTVRPVAWAGFEEGYLATANITWADTERGRGPTGVAIRSGVSACIQDFAEDASAAPWRESAERHGFRSSVALPLKDERAVTFGALNIYSAERGVFTPDEVRLLEELAGDLAYGITTLRHRAERKRAGEDLALLSFALNNVREAAFLIDETAHFHFVNEESCRVLGYTRAELLALGVPEVDPGFPIERWPDHWDELKARRSLSFESRHRTKEGRILPVEVSANYLEYGGRVFDLALVRDITERKQAEVVLQESEERFRDLYENAPNAYFSIGTDGVIRRCNRRAAELLGCVAAGLVGRAVVELYADTPCGKAKAAQVLERFRAGETVRDEELQMRKADGQTVWVSLTVDAVRDAQGRIVESRSMAVDITERKHAEQERLAHLRLLEAMDQINRVVRGTNELEQMMQDVLDAVLTIFDCDRAWLVHPCDPAATTFRVPMERCRPEFAGTSAVGLEVPVAPEIAQLLRTLCFFDGPVRFGPGAEHPLPPGMAKRFNIQSQMAMAIYPKTGGAYAFGLHQCSYARVWAEEAAQLFQEVGRRIGDALTGLLAYRELRESEQRFRLVFENSPVPSAEEDFSEVNRLFDRWHQEGVTDLEAYFDQHPEAVRQCADAVKFVDANRAALALHAAASKEDLLTRITETFTPETVGVFRRALVRLWQGGTELSEDTAIQTLAGELRQVTVSLSVCPGYEPTLAKVLVSLADITERKRAEEALQRAHQNYVTLVNTIDGIVWEADPRTFAFSFVSGQAERLLGYPIARWLAEPTFWKDHLHPEDRDWAVDFCGTAVQEKRSHDFEYRMMAADGRVLWLRDIVTVLVENGEVTHLRGIMLDSTGRKRAEATREALLALEARLGEAATPLEAARTIFATADQLWDWDCGALDLCSPEEDRVDSVLSLDVVEGQRREVPSALMSGGLSPRMRRVLRDGPELILRCPPIERPTDAVMFGDTSRPSASIMCVPLRRKGQPVGVLSVQSYTPNAFTKDDLMTLQGLADHWGGALERIRATAALRESEARYRELILHQGEGLGIVDPQEHFTFANPAGEAIFGVPSGGLVGRSLREFTTEAEYDRILAQTQKRCAGEKSTYEMEILLPDGETRCILVSAVPQTDASGQFMGTLGLFLDITDRKRTEAELLKLNQELDQRVKERTAELETKNRELERLNKLFVGRELRMAELKRRLKELERQSQSGESKTGA